MNILLSGEVAIFPGPSAHTTTVMLAPGINHVWSSMTTVWIELIWYVSGVFTSFCPQCLVDLPMTPQEGSTVILASQSHPTPSLTQLLLTCTSAFLYCAWDPSCCWGCSFLVVQWHKPLMWPNHNLLTIIS